MPTDALTDRATALVNAASNERHQNLSASLQRIRAAMNSRGVLISTMHVKEVSETCASELRNIAGLVWDNVKRAHESCGSKTSVDLFALFRTLLLAESTKMERVQEGAVGHILGQLQNKTLTSTSKVRETYSDLLTQYKAEIDIYVSNLRQGAGSTIRDRLRSKFMNNPVLVTIVLVMGTIVLLAAFTDAISKLSAFVKGVLGDG